MAHKHILLELNDGISATTPEVVSEVKILPKSLISLKFVEALGKLLPVATIHPYQE